MNGYKKEKINASLSEANGNQEVFDYLFICLFVCFGSSGSSSLGLGFCLVVVHGLLIVVASLVVEHRLQGVRASVVGALGLSSCSAWA